MDTIDRISPTRRPNQPVVMRPGWHQLLFLHWAVEPEQLQRLLPPDLELDLYDGKAYVGLVPFTMTNVQPRGLPPLRALTDFHEINVRIYVHQAGRNPGVWFFSLDAASAPAVYAARWWFRLPYFYARMQLTHRNGVVRYSSQRIGTPAGKACCKVEYTVEGHPAPAMPGTLEHFLAERYFLYSWARGKLFSGRVHHTPYPLQTARLHSLSENLIEQAGIRRGNDAPLVHYAREVRTEIFKLKTADAEAD